MSDDALKFVVSGVFIAVGLLCVWTVKSVQEFPAWMAKTTVQIASLESAGVSLKAELKELQGGVAHMREDVQKLKFEFPARQKEASGFSSDASERMDRMEKLLLKLADGHERK